VGRENINPSRTVARDKKEDQWIKFDQRWKGNGANDKEVLHRLRSHRNLRRPSRFRGKRKITLISTGTEKKREGNKKKVLEQRK